MRFKHLDLNLLLALDVLLKERSVSRAARALNLSQPALSAALARLREYFADELLVQHGNHMLPTAHAQTLAPMVSEALAQINKLIAVSTAFSPETSRRVFHVCASDYATVIMLVPLLSDLASCAPHVRIRISSPSPGERVRLEQGELDLLIAPEQYLAMNHPKQLLFEERHVIVGCRDNPLFRHKITEADFSAHRHIGVELGYAQSFVDDMMLQLGRRRDIAILAPSFTAVPWMLPNTPYLAVMLKRLAVFMAKRLPLAIAPLPFRFPRMREMIQYHVIKRLDSGIQWLLKRILEQASLSDGLLFRSMMIR